MTDRLYPQRLKCKQCRKNLTPPVIAGQYCSYKCAKTIEPTGDIEKTPRHCKRQVNNVWGFKTRFDAPSLVPQKYQADPSTNIYLCDNCHQYHIGHSRIETSNPREQLIRHVKYTQLGSVIERYMVEHNYTLKQVATALKVPQKRIKEVWENNPKVTVVFLFQLLNYLKLRVELTSPPKQ